MRIGKSTTSIRRRMPREYLVFPKYRQIDELLGQRARKLRIEECVRFDRLRIDADVHRFVRTMRARVRVDHPVQNERQARETPSKKCNERDRAPKTDAKRL